MTLQKIDTATGEILPVPFSFADVQDMAAAIVRGGLFPQFKSPEQALSLMLLCQAKGLHPMLAVERYDLIQGRPAMKTSYLLAEFKARGGRVQWHNDPTDECVGGLFVGPNGDTMEVVWTKERAIKAKLWSKQGPWQDFPQHMLRARCIGEAIRALAPECLHGLYTTDEVADMPPLPPPINVTPAREQMATSPRQLPAPKDAQFSPAMERAAAQHHDLLMEARSAFDAMAAKLGHPITSGQARGELANRVLGRPADSREGFTLADWNRATAKLPAFLTSVAVDSDRNVTSERQTAAAAPGAAEEEEDTSEPTQDVQPAATDAAIDSDPFAESPDARPNYAQAELSAGRGKRGGK